MWLWVEGADGQRSWKPVTIGYERPEDDRKVSVCMEKGQLRPKWVSERWYRKLPYYHGGKKGKRKALGE